VSTFQHFPSDTICPLCGNNNDEECTLISVDETEVGDRCQAQPVHLSCFLIHASEFRMNREKTIVYIRAIEPKPGVKG